jgi:hypothetical protein
MNDKQLESAARRLCDLRGLDPDEKVWHGADPDEHGRVPGIAIQSSRWRRAAREITVWNDLRTAYTHGMTFNE